MKSRVARFVLVHYTKTIKNCTKRQQNGHKIFQMPVKNSQWPQNISTFSNLRSSKIYPNWYFGFENKPSGNPDEEPGRRAPKNKNEENTNDLFTATKI
jgi:hypothetical protein